MVMGLPGLATERVANGCGDALSCKYNQSQTGALNKNKQVTFPSLVGETTVQSLLWADRHCTNLSWSLPGPKKSFPLEYFWPSLLPAPSTAQVSLLSHCPGGYAVPTLATHLRRSRIFIVYDRQGERVAVTPEGKQISRSRRSRTWRSPHANFCISKRNSFPVA